MDVDFVGTTKVAAILKERLGGHKEIGAATAFLASSAAGSITGESLAVDGGVTRGIYL